MTSFSYGRLIMAFLISSSVIGFTSNGIIPRREVEKTDFVA